MGELDKAMGFIGMLGRKTNQGAKKLTEKVKEEKYHYDLRKRGQVEAKTESMLRGAQLKRYQEILASIAHDRAIATDERRPMQERIMAQGRVEGNREIRNRIEKQTLEALKPKKNQNQNQNRQQGRHGQGQNQNNSHPDLLFYDESIMPPGGAGSNGSGSSGRSSGGRSSGGARRGRRTAGSRR